jgi:ABC-type transport system involved in cytochrome c biogenesis permease component
VSQQKFWSALFDLNFSRFSVSQFAAQYFAVALICLGLAAIYCAIKWTEFVLPILMLPLAVVVVRCLIESVIAQQQTARYVAEQARRSRPGDLENQSQ